MRRFLLTLILAVGSAGAQPQSSDAFATALQSQVEALNSGDTQALGAPVAWGQWIYTFYTHRSFKPAWVDPHTSAELRRALEDSRLDGLDPADYHLPLLAQLANQMTGNV